MSARVKLPPDQVARYVIARQDAATDPALARLFTQVREGKAGASDSLAEKIQVPRGVLAILGGVDPGQLLAQPEIASLVAELRKSQPSVADTRPAGATLMSKGRNPPKLESSVTQVGSRFAVTLVDLPKRAFASPAERAAHADRTLPKTEEPEDTSKFALHPYGIDHTRAMIMDAIAAGPAEITKRLGEHKGGALDVPGLDRVYDAAVQAATTRLAAKGLPKDEDEALPSTATLRTTFARAVAEEGARMLGELSFPSGAGLSDHALQKHVQAAFVAGTMKAFAEEHVPKGPVDELLGKFNAGGRLSYDRVV